jgi:quercetin dioxygenase-like cupin family protein
MSQVENGQVSPSISSMQKIATAVGVTLGDFFGAVTGGEGGLIVRVAKRPGLSSAWSNAEIEALSVLGPLARVEAMLMTLRPGGRSGKRPYAYPREEFAFVIQGEVILTLGPEEYRLRRGDAATILPGELRLWRNEEVVGDLRLRRTGLLQEPRRAFEDREHQAYSRRSTQP